MPDIDVDFCSSRRDEVIEHIYKTFGNENVAVVANVNTMSPRSAVRIVAEALGFAPTEINALAKHVPRHGDAARIREYLAGAWPELRDSPLQDSAPRAAAARRHARRPAAATGASSTWSSASTPSPCTWAPTWGASSSPTGPSPTTPRSSGRPRGWWSSSSTRTTSPPWAWSRWTSSASAPTRPSRRPCHLIRQRTGRRIRPYDLPPDDPAAYEIISNGGSIGLFQLESAGQRNLASRLQERDFDDVIAAIALYRPGPLEAEMIGPFIDRRWGLEPVSPPPPRHGRGGGRHLRGDPLPGAGAAHRPVGGRVRPGRRRLPPPRHDPRPQPGGDGQDRRDLHRRRRRPGRAGGRRPRGLPPAGGLRRLRVQQEPLGVLRRHQLRHRLAQGLLPGRVPVLRAEQLPHGVLHAAHGAERRPAVRAGGAAAGHQPVGAGVHGGG